MGRVNVADFKARALTRQTARAKRRKTALMSDFRQRIGLVHELRKLRRAKELPHRRSGWFRIDQVMGHHRIDFDRAHTLTDRTLHPKKADAILILHQLADGPDATVAQMVDIVHLAPAVFQFDQDLEDREDVLFAQNAHMIGHILEIQARIHFHPADGRQVIALRIEE